MSHKQLFPQSTEVGTRLNCAVTAIESTVGNKYKPHITTHILPLIHLCLPYALPFAVIGPTAYYSPHKVDTVVNLAVRSSRHLACTPTTKSAVLCNAPKKAFVVNR